jgi:glycolate oxidase iron-sulfur subunit
MSVEIENAKIEIREIIEKCVKCGLCKELCPVIKVMREEAYGPRGKIIMLENDFIEKIVYDCNLCRACEKTCPAGVKLCSAFVLAREVLVQQKREPVEARDIIRNLDKTGNPYGVKEEE